MCQVTESPSPVIKAHDGNNGQSGRKRGFALQPSNLGKLHCRTFGSKPRRSMQLKFSRLCIAVALFAGITVGIVAQDTATANVGGNWTVVTQGQRGSGTHKMSIRQDGSKISGSLESDRGDESLQGSVEGNDIHFSVSINTPRGAMTLEYDGKVRGDSMKGTMRSPFGSGSWSAKRESQ